MRPELQEIVDEASRVLEADTTLEDTDFNLIAYGTQRFQVDEVRSHSILQRGSTRPVRDWFEHFGIARSADPLRIPADVSQGLHARICIPARWRGVTYGYLWALDDATSLADPRVVRGAQLAEHAAAYLAQLSRQHEDEAYAVADLISGDVEKTQQAAARIADRGLIDQRSPVVAVVVTAQGPGVPPSLSPNLWSLPRSVLVDRGGLSTTLVVPLRDIADDEPGQQAATTTVELYRRELPLDWTGELVAGLGRPRADLNDLRASWLEAKLATRIALAVPEHRPVARWPDLGLYRLLMALPMTELDALVLDDPVRRLLDNPDPTMATTVKVFLDLAGNVRDAAAALHIHRQTLYYRLAKAQELTGLDLDRGQDRLRLHLGLMLAPTLADAS
ncbi:MAG: PucR family transcriptional regulator [Propionibacteriaceae bacterium]